MSVFADKLKDGGVDTAGARLDALLFKRLGKLAKPDSRVVARNSIKEVWNDLELLQAVIGWSLCERKLFERAEECERSMKNSPKGDAGVRVEDGCQEALGARNSIPRDDPGEGDGVQLVVDSQILNGPTPSSPDEREAIQTVVKNQNKDGPSLSSSNRNGVVPLPAESQTGFGRVVPIPNKPRSLAEMQRTKAIVKPSIFETCSIRGEPLDKMSRGRLKRLRFENLFESALATLILNYASGPDEMLVPEIIQPSQLSKMILEAQEIANAA